jgi:chromosome segregation ATPase
MSSRRSEDSAENHAKDLEEYQEIVKDLQKKLASSKASEKLLKSNNTALTTRIAELTAVNDNLHARCSDQNVLLNHLCESNNISFLSLFHAVLHLFFSSPQQGRKFSPRPPIQMSILM